MKNKSRRQTSKPRSTSRVFRTNRNHFVINKSFQWRYTSYLVTTVMTATLLTGGVTAFFLNQNYGIFTRLAYLHAPDLLPQLEREQIWINTFLVAFFITLLSFNLLYGLRVTSRIAGPIAVLKRHIYMLSHGLFSNPTLQLRESDEFEDLVESYNYLYRSLQSQIKRDVKLMTEVLEERNSQKARETLLRILDEKQRQLTDPVATVTTSATSSSSGPNPASRRVS